MKLTKQLLILLLLSQACKEVEILEVPTNGTLKGFVWNEHPSYGDPISGVEITVEGTEPSLVLTSGEDGSFTLDDLPTGTYNLTFEMPGYGVRKLLGYTFIAGSEPTYEDVVLYLLPQAKIADFSMTLANLTDYISVQGIISVDWSTPTSLYFRYYISNSQDLSPRNYMLTGTALSFGGTRVNVDALLRTEMFPPGSEVYMVVYPCREPYSSYIDLETGKKVYTSISTQGSEVLSAIVPM